MRKKLRFNLYALILIILIGVTYKYNNYLNAESQVIHEIVLPEVEATKVVKYTTPIFFPNKTFTKFDMGEVTLTENLKTTEAILKEILSNLVIKLKAKKIISKKSYKNEIYLDNRTLYLDLDSRIFENSKTTREEMMILYSFVNSLLAPGGSDEVIILINGKSVKTLKYITLAKTYKMNTTI